MYQPLLDYIKKTRVAGMKDSQIRQELTRVNWKKEYIEEAFKACGRVADKNRSVKIIVFVILAILLIGLIALGFWYK